MFGLDHSPAGRLSLMSLESADDDPFPLLDAAGGIGIATISMWLLAPGSDISRPADPQPT